MRWNWKYAAISIALFCVEILIWWVFNDTFIRPFVGDLLIVILMYTSLKTVLKSSPKKILAGVLVFAFLVEGAQYIHLIDKLNWSGYSVPNIILGNTFDRFDLLAYLLGGGITYYMDISSTNKERAILVVTLVSTGFLLGYSLAVNF